MEALLGAFTKLCVSDDTLSEGDFAIVKNLRRSAKAPVTGL